MFYNKYRVVKSHFFCKYGFSLADKYINNKNKYINDKTINDKIYYCKNINRNNNFITLAENKNDRS